MSEVDVTAFTCTKRTYTPVLAFCGQKYKKYRYIHKVMTTLCRCMYKLATDSVHKQNYS